MSIDYKDAWSRAREERPFANGTEGYGWMANWCDRCLVDAPFRNGISPTGCPLILIAFEGRTPAEWLDQKTTTLSPRGVEMYEPYSIEDQYHCIEFRAPGGGGGGEPRPRPTPTRAALPLRPSRGRGPTDAHDGAGRDARTGRRRVIRVRIYKRYSTPLGMAEVTLLDVPLDAEKWSARDALAVNKLEERASAVLSDPAPNVKTSAGATRRKTGATR